VEILALVVPNGAQPRRRRQPAAGRIKHWMYQGALLMRGLANVRVAFSLTALAYNLRCALNISASRR